MEVTCFSLNQVWWRDKMALSEWKRSPGPGNNFATILLTDLGFTNCESQLWITIILTIILTQLWITIILTLLRDLSLVFSILWVSSYWWEFLQCMSFEQSAKQGQMYISRNGSLDPRDNVYWSKMLLFCSFLFAFVRNPSNQYLCPVAWLRWHLIWLGLHTQGLHIVHISFS